MTTSSTAERLARAAMGLFVALLVAGCGGASQDDDNVTLSPALAPSQPANAWNRKTGF